MNETIKRFERYLQCRYGDRSTPKHYMSDMRIFVRHVGDKPPVEVSVKDIDSFMDQQAAQGLSPATMNRRLAALRTFFEFLASEEPDRPWPNPVNWRRHKVKEGEALPRDIPDWAVAQLFAAIDDDRDRAIFGLMVGAGLRVGEVVSLRLQDLEAPSSANEMACLRVQGKGRKERMVWLTSPLYATVQVWLQKRPSSSSEHLFLNQHGRPLSEAGVQYRLHEHAERAGLQVTCHQLRHTFARRLAEQDMPIESLSKLLGHAQVQTTQIYTAGADPKLQAAFAQAMSQLEEPSHAPVAPEAGMSSRSLPNRKQEQADPAGLERCLAIFDPLPEWLRSLLCTFLTWRWRNWQPHQAEKLGNNIALLLLRTWNRLFSQQVLRGWADLRRSHLEAWLAGRQEAGIAASSQATELGELLSFLRFVADQDLPLDANLFRVAYPQRTEALPRYLTEPEYKRLEQVVLSQAADESPTAVRDRAWFLTLAHTGLRLSELLNLRVGDLDLPAGRLTVRGGKNFRDRAAYLTPVLVQALQAYLLHRDSAADDHLWLDAGRPLRDHHVRYRLRRWGQLCDVAVTPHRLRHTFATRLINHGLSLESLSKLLGHKHLSMTQRYARIHDATVRNQFQQAMAAIEGIAVSDWPQPQPAFAVADQSAVYQKADSV
jgi:site-specific recombinase XerD